MLIKDWLLRSVAVFDRPNEGDQGGGDPPVEGGTPPAGDGAGEGDGASGSESGAAGEEGNGEGADGQDGGAPEPKTPVVAAPKADWRDKEIRRKHTKLTEAQQRVLDLEEENRTLRELAERGGARAKAPAAGEGDGEPEPVRAASGDVDPNSPAVQQAAQRLRAADKYNEDCNATFTAGAKTYGDKWEPALAQLKLLGGIDGGVMTEILATDDPAQTLFKMSSDPDTFHRVMDLPPARRMAELVKLGLPQPKPKGKQVSGAPAPVDTVGGRASPDSNNLSDELTDEQWYARRGKQKADKWAAQQGQRRAS